jgi:hypothetical protein
MRCLTEDEWLALEMLRAMPDQAIILPPSNATKLLDRLAAEGILTATPAGEYMMYELD